MSRFQIFCLFLGQFAVLLPDCVELLVPGLLALIQLFLQRVNSLPISAGLSFISTLQFSIVLNQSLNLIVLGDKQLCKSVVLCIEGVVFYGEFLDAWLKTTDGTAFDGHLSLKIIKYNFCSIQYSNTLDMRTLKVTKLMIAPSQMLRSCSLQGGLLGKRWFSSSNSINDMTEVREGTRYFQEKMMNQAIQHFQRSLTILPFYIKDNTQYNQEFDDVVNRLVRGYAWKGQTGKIEALSSKVIEESLKLGLELSQKTKEVSDVLSIIGKGKTVISCDRKQQIQNNFKQIVQKGKDFDIIKGLVSPRKPEQQNTIDLSEYIHSELRSSTAFIYTSLLTQPSFPTNAQYNKMCNTLLKGAERSSQKNIIKPLSILVTNLLRNKQYLQAQGMIQYCLDRKRQNIKLNHLRQNQQFILLNLFLSQTYEGVDRHQQSKRIQAQYNPIFNFQTFILQHFLIDSI